ncbi:MAG: putative endonuclease [Chloroflexota bacterium]|nr:putative endonuclease [Chloroflexota bacterium]
MAFYCYLLECADGSYYCGWTKDVEKRVQTHNRGQGARYTRTRRPVRLVYVEELESQSEAMRREHRLKQRTHAAKTRLIEQYQEKDHDD